jgi:glycolate oxidase
VRDVTDEDAVLARCAAVLEDRDVLTDPQVLPTYSRDRSTGSPVGEPFAAVFPRTTAQVSAVMAAAHEHRVPVVPRGAGSGLAGGSNAIDGCLVVSLERMRDVLGVNEQDGYVETQPGILNTELREHVRGHGLWYAPDPASKDFCSIGGNVNTNAGGLCCVKYGVTREAVLGLEVVLADGRVTRLGRRTVKGVAGYDLAGMIVGSEGTLGIVTMARLRLRPLPPPAATTIAVFADIAAAGRAVAAIMATLTPSMLELMDAATVAAVEQYQPMGLDTSAQALLIAQTDAIGSGALAEAQTVLEICQRNGAVEAHCSDDPQEAELLLGARRMAIPAIEALGDWLLDDVSVPRSALAEAMLRIQDVATDNDVQIFTFGHAGDGNLHPTIVTPRGDEQAAVRGMNAFTAILDLALRLGGTITGEHGVGALKNAALGRELDDVAVGLHERVKAAWDPAGILNPGKALPRW